MALTRLVSPRKSLAAIGVAILLALGPAALTAQNPPASPPAEAKPKNFAYRYRLLGVYDEQSGDPIQGAEVSDILNGNKSLTSATGTVSLLFLPEGGSLVRIKKIGYAMQTLTVAISPTDTAPVTIVLSRATELPTVVVKDSAPKHLTPHMQTFEDHRKQGFGEFITEDEMRKNDDRTMANLLSAKLAGLQQVAGRTSSTYIVSSRKMCAGPALTSCRTPNCYVRVYTDGILTYGGGVGATLPDFARINVSDYAAVEFYPSSAVLPEGISPTNSDCGTLLLYTRER